MAYNAYGLQMNIYRPQIGTYGLSYVSLACPIDVLQVELLGFSETEEMRECRKANEKLQSFLMVYFDRTWRQVANDVKPAIKDRIKELLKERTPVDRRSAIFNFQDQADFAPVLQCRQLAHLYTCLHTCPYTGDAVSRALRRRA